MNNCIDGKLARNALVPTKPISDFKPATKPIDREIFGKGPDQAGGHAQAKSMSALLKRILASTACRPRSLPIPELL